MSEVAVEELRRGLGGSFFRLPTHAHLSASFPCEVGELADACGGRHGSSPFPFFFSFFFFLALTLSLLQAALVALLCVALVAAREGILQCRTRSEQDLAQASTARLVWTPVVRKGTLVANTFFNAAEASD